MKNSKYHFVFRAIYCASLLSASVFGAEIHVPADFPAIQDALNAAQAGDTILAAPGSYYENLVWPAISEIILASDTQDPSGTIIDGGNAGRVITIAGDMNARISGFTLTRGAVSQSGDRGPFGAGVFAENASVIIENAIVSANSVDGTSASFYAGGGIYVINGSIELSDSQISANILSDGWLNCNGGGIYIEASPAVISRCTFEGNQIIGGDHPSGGGLAAFHGGQNSTITLDSNVFLNNHAESMGGGFYIECSSLIFNNVIAGNSIYGATIWEQPLLLAHNTFVDNDHAHIGLSADAAIFGNIFIGSDNSILANGYDVHLYVNDFWNVVNPYSEEFTAIANIERDPMMDASYHLTDQSPCIDWIVDHVIDYDIDGDARPLGNGFDIGADEFVPVATPTPVPPTPTPEPGNTGIELIMPADEFQGGDPCYLHAMVTNALEENLECALFILLDVYGSYFYLSDESAEFPPGHTLVIIIPEFSWPYGIPAGSGLLYGVLTDIEMTEMIGSMSTWAFSWS